MIFKKQIKNEKPRQHNLFYSAFNITPSKDKLLISKPSVFADLGLPSPKPGTRSLSFDDHFSPLIDKELPQLDIILDLIEKDENKEIILKAIGPDYLKNETSLIFEHNNEKITICLY